MPMNPMLAKLPNNLNQIKQIVTTIKTAKDPEALFNRMMQNNPGYRQAVDYVKQNGGDPKKAFQTLAKQNGLDPNEIANLFR